MNIAGLFPPTSTRVERSTAPEFNQAIRERSDAEVDRLASAPPDAISAHLRELDDEWGVERTLQANASTLVLVGIALGAFVDRRFLLLPVAVFGFFAQHALQGWCPPIPVFRRLGVRTMREIERERYAVKALRGDFDQLPAKGAATTRERVQAVVAAVDA